MFLFEAAQKLIEAAMKHEETKHLAADLIAGVLLVHKVGVEVDEALVCRECAGKPCTVMGLIKTLFAAAKATQKLLVTKETAKRALRFAAGLWHNGENGRQMRGFGPENPQSLQAT